MTPRMVGRVSGDRFQAGWVYDKAGTADKTVGVGSLREKPIPPAENCT